MNDKRREQFFKNNPYVASQVNTAQVFNRLSELCNRVVIDPVPGSTGFTLTDSSDSLSGSLKKGIFPFILTAVIVGCVVIVWGLGILEGGNMPTFALIVGGLLMLAFSAVTVDLWKKFIQQLLIARRYQPGELNLSHWPLRLGDEANLVFRRKMRGQEKFQSGTLEAKLLCCERVVYRQGTNVRKAYAYAQEIELDTKQVYSGSREIQESWQIQIPSDAAPSLELRYNQVRWYLEIWLKQDGAPNDDSVFGLKLTP